MNGLSQEQRKKILELAAVYGAGNVRLFGSRARGDAKEDSDYDFLVAMEKGRSLFDLINFQLEAEKMLDARVDVVDEDGISHPRLLEYILNDAKPL